MRESIIYLKAPFAVTPDQMSGLQSKFAEDLKLLNEEQQTAVLRCILADNYHMVLGTPGSGKSTAIVVLLKILAKLKRRVLLVSFTNSALDNVLIKLQD